MDEVTQEHLSQVLGEIDKVMVDFLLIKNRELGEKEFGALCLTFLHTVSVSAASLAIGMIESEELQDTFLSRVVRDTKLFCKKDSLWKTESEKH